MKNLFVCAFALSASLTLSAQDAAPAAWNTDAMQLILKEVEASAAGSSTAKLYRKRLLMLLPLIQKSHNPDVTTQETKGNTALHYACGLSHTELVKWLIAHGADVDARTDKGASADDCLSGKNATAIRALLRQARAEKTARIEAEFAAKPELLVDYAGAVVCARELEKLFAGIEESEIAYSAAEKEEFTRLYAENLYHYVQTMRRLPFGVLENSAVGRMALYALSHEFSATQMQEWAIAVLRGDGENKLDEILESLSFFADARLLIPDVSDAVTEVVVSFDPTGKSAPEVRVERRKVKTYIKPYDVKLHFCGRVSLKDGAEATVLLGAEYAHVDVAEPEARFDADIAGHFGKHCRLISYFTGNTCLQLYYTPEGEINTQRTQESAVPQSVHVFPVYFKVKPESKKN